MVFRLLGTMSVHFEFPFWRSDCNSPYRRNGPSPARFLARLRSALFPAARAAAETSYQALAGNPRVAVPEELRGRPDAGVRKVIEAPGYTFHVLFTTLAHDPVQTWHFYNSRADNENRLKELQEDFGADGFCLQSFNGPEAVFRPICFLFNPIATSNATPPKTRPHA
jgi:hypothetical protein